MKLHSLLSLTCVLLGAATLANGQSVSRCFQSDWLQGERAVKLSLNGNRVSGIFIVKGADEADKEYQFTGTRRGNSLTVAFAGNHLPDVAPSEMKSLVWMLVRVRGRELLRIKFYGKNYETNKYRSRFVYFAVCGSS